MKALVTGASSGIGRNIAIYLSELGYDLILVARDKKKLIETSKLIHTKSKCITLDLSKESNCIKLYKQTKKDDIDILVNNAGFGLLGEFYNTDLDIELNMIDLNIKCVHILTKLYLNDFKKKNKGYILNVASAAAFQSGPLMSAYYASKAYVLRLSVAIYEELKQINSNVKISVLCPGPVDTNFNKVANAKFKIKPLTSEYVSKHAINSMFKNKLIIIPSFYMKVVIFFSRFISIKKLAKITYNIQSKKR